MSASNPQLDLSASAILERYQPRSELVAKARQHNHPLKFVNDLLAGEEFESAVDFLAHWLPPQHSVWWGCLCAWHLNRSQPAEGMDEAMALVIAWLTHPAEETRQPLVQIDKGFTLKHPMGLLAKAAYYTGPSMSPPKLPVVAPPPYLCSQLVSGAVQLVVAYLPPADRSSNYKQLIRMGTEVLHGSNRWTVAS
jgi:hypothetical protein